MNRAVVLNGFSDVHIEDSVIGRGGGLGLFFETPGPDTETTIDRSLFYENGDTQVNVGGGSLKLTDIVSRDTSAAAVFGDGLYFAFGDVQISRGLFERHNHSAIWVFDCSATIEDVVIDDMPAGVGIDLQEADTTIARAAISRTTNAIEVYGGKLHGSDLRAGDSTITALAVYPNADVHADRILLEHACNGTAIASAAIDLKRAIIRNIACNNNVLWYRLLLERDMRSEQDPSLMLEEFLFEHCNDIALDVSVGRVQLLKNGKIRDSGIGARLPCVKPEEFFEQVELSRNGQSFQPACN